jgi:hypothetical protein
MALELGNAVAGTDVSTANGDYDLIGIRTDADPLDVIDGGTVTANAAFLLTGIADFSGASTKAYLYLNGSRIALNDAGAFDNVGSTDNTDSQAVSIGYETGACLGNYFGGSIAETIAYPFALTTPSRSAVEQYLISKYGLP